MKDEDNRMMLISEVSRLTGKSTSTIRRWAEQGLLKPSQRRVKKQYIAWYTTVNAVMAVVKNPPKMGRPHKRT